MNLFAEWNLIGIGKLDGEELSWNPNSSVGFKWYD